MTEKMSVNTSVARRPVTRFLKPCCKLFVFATVLLCSVFVAEASVVAGPDIKNWDIRIERPAVGTISSEPLDWRGDSVLTFQVRYISSVSQPSAVCSYTVTAPVLRKYKFEGYVNITRADAGVTFRYVDGADNALKILAVSTSSDQPGAFTPGRWTKVEFEIDFSDDIAVDADVSQLRLEILPQWADGAIVSDASPVIMVSDAMLYNTNVEGYYPAYDWPGGDMEVWTGDRNIYDTMAEGWTMKNARPVGGSHAADSGAQIPANSVVTCEYLYAKWTRPNYYSHKQPAYNRVSFRAMASSKPVLTCMVDGHVTAVPCDDVRDWSKAEVTKNFILGDQWQKYVITLPEKNFWDHISFSATGDWMLDDVRIYTEYDDGQHHHYEDFLTVTSSADSGDGSLRDIIAQAPAFSQIKFDVDDVYLEAPLQLGDKTLSFDGRHIRNYNKVIIHAPEGASAIEFVSTRSGNYAYFEDVVFYGSESGVSNGGIISVPEKRSEFTGFLQFDYCTFNNGIASTNGGAIYMNTDPVSLILNFCRFSYCKAANGAAVSMAKGKALSVRDAFFEDCITTGSTGGTVSVTGTDTKANIDWTSFTNCQSLSTSGGAGAVSILSQTAKVNITRTLFDNCSGGRAAAVSAYNNTRGTVSGRLAMVNCAVINSNGTSPAVSVSASGSYTPLASAFVNNIFAYNDGDDLVAPASAEGTNNIINHTELQLPNTISILNGERVFNNYDETTGRPVKTNYNTWSAYAICIDGPAFDGGAQSFVTSGGEELITDVVKDWYSDEWNIMSGRLGHPVISLGHTELYDWNVSVEDIAADRKDDIRLWPNPVKTEFHVDGIFDKMWITSMSGVTVYAGYGPTVNASFLTPGQYIVSFLVDGNVVTKKIIKL